MPQNVDQNKNQMELITKIKYNSEQRQIVPQNKKNVAQNRRRYNNIITTLYENLFVCTYLLPNVVPLLIRKCLFLQPQAVHFQGYHKIIRETNKLKRLHEVESVVLLNLCCPCCKHMLPMQCSTHKPEHRALYNQIPMSTIVYIIIVVLQYYNLDGGKENVKYLACFHF
jgi:hypothetical protein